MLTHECWTSINMPKMFPHFQDDLGIKEPIFKWNASQVLSTVPTFSYGSTSSQSDHLGSLTFQVIVHLSSRRNSWRCSKHHIYPTHTSFFIFFIFFLRRKRASIMHNALAIRCWSRRAYVRAWISQEQKVV